MATTPASGQYLLRDQPRTLFPLRLTEILVQHSSADLYAEIDRILKTDPKANTGFLTQIPCHAAKRGLHSRRTLKLDPLAELFIYDLAYRERATFPSSLRPDRRRFGYVFQKNRPLPATTSYGEFRDAVRDAACNFKYHLGVDIASYFNSIYHHDLVFWFDDDQRDAQTVQNFGRYFREIVGGRSVDCLPQGLHPCKMIGAHFLNKVDTYHKLRSSLMLRFMDDIYLFDDDRGALEEDFLLLQRYLGDRSFSFNADKTTWGQGPLQSGTTIDDVKIQLLELRRIALELEYGELYYMGAERAAEETEPLTPGQIDYLEKLLNEDDIDEGDAELVLSLIGERAEDELDHLVGVFQRFPALARSVYAVADNIGDKEELCTQLTRIAKERRALTEDQLFWAAKITEDYLSDSSGSLGLLSTLHSHAASTDLTKAKILEIPWPDLDDMRDEYLKGGRSDWLAWSSAIGSRRVAKRKRNHLLTYYAKGSPMNRIIAGCVRQL